MRKKIKKSICRPQLAQEPAENIDLKYRSNAEITDHTYKYPYVRRRISGACLFDRGTISEERCEHLYRWCSRTDGHIEERWHSAVEDFPLLMNISVS